MVIGDPVPVRGLGNTQSRVRLKAGVAGVQEAMLMLRGEPRDAHAALDGACVRRH